jgi:hypothetical protein
LRVEQVKLEFEGNHGVPAPGGEAVDCPLQHVARLEVCRVSVLTGGSQHLGAGLVAPVVQAQATRDQVKVRIGIAVVYAVANAFERLSQRVQNEHAGWHRQALLRKRG